MTLDVTDAALRTLALDPQTSGGLLVGVPRQHADAWRGGCEEQNVAAVKIGDVTEGTGVRITA